MRRVIQTLVVLAALGAVGGAAVVFGGLYNVSARAGHWWITTWVLHTTFRNAVELRAPAESEVPDLTMTGMAALGAKHFDAGCRTCHAAPGDDRWAVPTAMVPRPPRIADAVAPWQANELHWIVDEGVKMSGMPHWPARRTDDVWPVVAFLENVDGMSGDAYDALTAHPVAPGGAPDDLPYCAMCHTTTGASTNPQVPRLDIQPQAYLEETLLAYADGTRESGIMHVAASRVERTALLELAAWFAEQPVSPAPMTPADDPSLIERGGDLAKAGTRDVPACTACHGPKTGPRSGGFPRLAGQSDVFLAQQLRLWRDGMRGGGNRSNLMAKSAQDLSDADIRALAAWFASQPAVKPDVTD